MRRFHHPDLDAGPDVWLAGDEGKHLARVLRAAPGDRVALFDGRGREVEAEVVEVERDRVRLAVRAEREPVRPLRPVTLVTALPRGKRMEWLVEKATEAGVAHVVPVVCARSARQDAGPTILRRWQRVALEAAKQCGRAVVPPVPPPVPLAEALEATAGMTRLVASPGAERTAADVLANCPAGRPVAVFVGPEGGFDPAESAALAAAGAVGVGLGRLILRVETAATVLVHAAAW